jgi:hypothetical protein
MFMDYVLNGQAHGEVGNMMMGCQFDPGLLRPYLDGKGQRCVTVNTGRTKWDEKKQIEVPILEKRLASELIANGIPIPTANATSLRKDDWLMLDKAVIKAARQRLRAWSDLQAANSFGGFNGMSKLILEHETQSDPGEAQMDFDGLTEGRNDAPQYQLEGLPLPITHSDFFFSSRRLAVSRNSQTPLDTTMAEAAGRRVAEMIEKTLIGVETGPTYGKAADYGQTPKVYGYINHPQRITKTDMTQPDGTNGSTVLTDWLALRDLLYVAKFYGPFMVYTSTEWDQHLDNLFSTTEPSAGTLRSRLKQIDGIQDIRRLDYLTDRSAKFDVLFVQMTSDVARAVNGMDITTVQWESQGGMRVNFKVMAIQVGQLRADFNGNMGLAHGTIS